MQRSTTHASLPLAARLRAHAIAAWLLVVLSAWSAVHGLNLYFEIAARCSEAQRFVFWTCAKIVAWLVPTVLLARLSATGSLRGWFGISTSDGMVRALLVTALWLLVQAAGANLGLPSNELPPREPNWADLPMALLIAPVFEELMFRGAMLRSLRERGSEREWAVLASALAFAALHVPGWFARRGLDASIAGSFLGIAGFGVVLGYLAWYARSLWAPVLLHAMHNAWSTGLLGWLMRNA